MYFKNFPQIEFLVSPPGYRKAAQYVSVVDITVNIRFIKQLIDNITLFDYYNIQGNETIEHIAEKLYGSPHYNWVIMLLNNIYDYRNDYVMTEEVFERFIINKYGSVEEALNNIVFYRNDDGITSTQYTFDLDEYKEISNPDFKPVTAYQYEAEKNDEKRRIKVVSKHMISLILKNFREAL